MWPSAGQGADSREDFLAKLDAALEARTGLLINLVQGGLIPDTSAAHLERLGFRIAIHPGVPLGAAAMAMLQPLAALHVTVTGGRPPESPAGFFELLGLTEWSELSERYRTGK